MQLFVKRLTKSAKLPTKAHNDDAGYDLYADEDVTIYPGETVKIHTGISIAPMSIMDSGYETVASLLWDRSGLGSKGIHRLAGVIDFSYRGEILVCLTNLNIYPILQEIYNIFLDASSHKKMSETIADNIYYVKKGDRIAQLLPQKVLKVELVETDDLVNSERGTDGFGSTGR